MHVCKFSYILYKLPRVIDRTIASIKPNEYLIVVCLFRHSFPQNNRILSRDFLIGINRIGNIYLDEIYYPFSQNSTVLSAYIRDIFTYEDNTIFSFLWLLKFIIVIKFEKKIKFTFSNIAVKHCGNICESHFPIVQRIGMKNASLK